VTCFLCPNGLNNSAQGQSRASRDATLVVCASDDALKGYIKRDMTAIATRIPYPCRYVILQGMIFVAFRSQVASRETCD